MGGRAAREGEGAGLLLVSTNRPATTPAYCVGYGMEHLGTSRRALPVASPVAGTIAEQRPSAARPSAARLSSL